MYNVNFEAPPIPAKWGKNPGIDIMDAPTIPTKWAPKMAMDAIVAANKPKRPEQIWSAPYHNYYGDDEPTLIYEMEEVDDYVDYDSEGHEVFDLFGGVDE